VTGEFLQSVYIKSSHPRLKHDWDLWDRLMELAPGRRGLDAGCGAGARDVFHAYSGGYDVTGIDAIEENIQAAQELHPEISDRVFVADLANELPFSDASFDFVACNAVIQHIDPAIVHSVVLPELVRVLRPGGVLELMFKCGEGIITVFDRDYGIDRTFRLYQETELLERLAGLGLALIEAASPEELGGVLYFTDPKPVDHCVFFARKAIPSP
jgi:SAM-dependent methyltransferase